ncbi:MAG: AAA family ATPase [Rubrivivax sp.]
MKIAVAGKGGVGKTTLSSLLARSYAAEGRRVLAIDADPDANLATAIGLPRERLAELKPIASMKQIAVERTGHAGGYGGFFKLNPTVDDLPESLSVTHAGVKILSLGAIEHGGSGCVCPEHALLRALMTHILVLRDDVVVMDMEAGVEHLGRGTADSVDCLVIVVEPGQRSLETGRQIERLAADLGIRRLAYVGSKVGSAEDLAFLRAALPAGQFMGALSLSPALQRADREGRAPYDLGGAVLDEALAIRRNLEAWVARPLPEKTPCA